MKFINTRDFLQNYKEELKDTPLIVTKRGRPYFVVTEPVLALSEDGALVDLARIKPDKAGDIKIEEIYIFDEARDEYKKRKVNEEIVEMMINPEAQQDNVREILDSK